MKARSELVTPRNFSDGCVLDTSVMFHAASPASNLPALRPTRGSGLGAPADASIDGVMPADAMPEDDVDDPAQPAAARAQSAISGENFEILVMNEYGEGTNV